MEVRAGAAAAASRWSCSRKQEAINLFYEDSLAFGIFFRQIESPGLKKLQKKDFGFLFQVGGIQSTGVLSYCFIFYFIFFFVFFFFLEGLCF